jgi:hypothetical protein
MEPTPIHTARLKQLFWLMLVLNIIYIAWMKWQLAPLQTSEILSFEISRTTDRASNWVNTWKGQPPKFERAITSLTYDYVFIFLYSIGLIVAVLQFGRFSGQDLLERSSRFIAALLVIAAICDVCENLFLGKVLADPSKEFAVRMAYNFAAAKFSILILTMLFLAVCMIFHFLKRFERKLVMGE